MQGTMRMRLNSRLRMLLPPAVGLAVALAACSRSGSDELTWARAALERNGTLEVIATDPAAGVLTVRVKSTGELRTVHPGDLIGALPTGAPETEVASTGAPAASPTSTAQSVPQPAVAAQAPPAVSGENAAASSAATSQAQPAPAAPTSGAASADQARAVAPAVTEKEKPVPKGDKRVLAAGPGYSISAAGPAVASTRTSQTGTDAGTGSTRGPVEQRHEPIVCQGGGLRHIDNRNLEFDGDALIAEDGCELHITNSRIAAQGVGVLVRAANVHIENSSIEGGPSAIEASDGAQIYAQSSTFKGMIRRLDTSSFHDLGGNVGD
jgi:hypothetical protein